MLPSDIDRSGLVPQTFTLSNGKQIYVFRDCHIDIVRIDFVFAAGTAFQSKKYQSTAAIQMIDEGTAHHSAGEIAEFMDYRGIILKKDNDLCSSTLTVYSLTRHLPELLTLLREIIEEPSYPEHEFEVYMSKRRQKLMANMQKTSYVARIHFYEHLFGPSHPEGGYATLADIDNLTVEDVRSFHRQHVSLENATIVLSGNVNDDVLSLFDKFTIQNSKFKIQNSQTSLVRNSNFSSGRYDYAIPQAVQTTLRVGRLLPFSWNDIDYARFMILSTALGGYFGSRLMQNIREDKGYTYGINAMTRVGYSGILFFITTDVAADKSEFALNEILKEIKRLREEPISHDEMSLLRDCMMGDFMRSIDGIFERAERFVQMLSAGVDESFTENYMSVLSPDAVTSEQLQALSSKLLQEKDLVIVTAGNTTT